MLATVARPFLFTREGGEEQQMTQVTENMVNDPGIKSVLRGKKMELRDSKFMAKEDKAKVLKQWRTFLKHGCQYKHFTKRLYEHLSLHCEFIAHFGRHGFYATYFEEGEDTAKFLSQFDKRNADFGGHIKSIEYGMTYWMTGEYSDVNAAMVEIASEYIPALLATAENKQRAVDMAEIERLAAKHGIEFSIA